MEFNNYFDNAVKYAEQHMGLYLTKSKVFSDWVELDAKYNDGPGVPVIYASPFVGVNSAGYVNNDDKYTITQYTLLEEKFIQAFKQYLKEQGEWPGSEEEEAHEF